MAVEERPRWYNKKECESSSAEADVERKSNVLFNVADNESDDLSMLVISPGLRVRRVFVLQRLQARLLPETRPTSDPRSPTTPISFQEIYCIGACNIQFDLPSGRGLDQVIGLPFCVVFTAQLFGG